jgi:alanyl-tRNA synthetase
MISQDIRRGFLNYFKTQSHTIVPSSPVVPHNDPSLLFTNAGMNQFKDVFLGKSKRDYTRATTTQKCIRGSDLENVGHTKRHLTFFEMLGNFSFGDYFKKEAIGFAWDVATHVFDLDPKKIWVSVFQDDDEAYELWQSHLPSSKIVRMGEKDNFWSMGKTGPCGPCTELLYDRGKNYSDAKSPLEDLSGERYLEFWNLVFMQYNKEEDGTLTPLPKKSIDTGSGLERVCLLKMGVDNVYLTDILRSLIAATEKLSGIKYDIENKELAPAFHIIADHLRTLVFAISDGVTPGNTDRGYFLRKLLRRAVRSGRLLNLKEPFLAKLVPALVEIMGDDYPEIKVYKSRCQEVLTVEEDNFIRTLHRGGSLLSDVIKNSKLRISANDAFKLKDTYGFPIEEILLIAKDSLLDVDLPGFNKLEEEAKEKSRKAQKVKSQTFDRNIFTDFVKTHKPSKFSGHQKEELSSRIVAILLDGKFTDELTSGQKGIIILDETPFYPEMGGQVGDEGEIFVGENRFLVSDTQSPYPGVIAHIGEMKSGKLTKEEKVHAKINKERRQKICNNHSATHLLQSALSSVLGDHIRQAGSIVDDMKLRFDFNHHQPLSYEEVKKVEMQVNAEIRKNIKVASYEMSLEEAQKNPDIKQLFGEKYQSTVRIVEIDKSKELCGGCHATFTGNIGFFKIAKESSISAGVRRIEAYTGAQAEKFCYDKQEYLLAIENVLSTSEGKLLEKIESLLEDHKILQAQLKTLRKSYLEHLKEKLLSEKEKIKGVQTIFSKVELLPSELVPVANELMAKLKSGLIVLAIVEKEKCQLLIKISPDLIEKGIMADLMIKEIADIINGGGGGKMDLAQAGGKEPSKIEAAFKILRSYVEKKC